MNRRLLQLGSLLLAGAIGNIVVAYLCLFWQQAPHVPQPQHSAAWYWQLYATPSNQRGPPTFQHLCGAIGCDFYILDASLVPSGQTASASYAPPRMMITRAGFPLRSLEGMHSWGPVTPVHSWGIPITPRNHNVSWVSILPCKPLIDGFVINSILYGFLLWLPTIGPMKWLSRMRRHENLRRGLCPACGYDLRGRVRGRGQMRGEADAPQTCPECGHQHRR